MSLLLGLRILTIEQLDAGAARPGPALSADTDEVVGNLLGYSAETIRQVRQEGAS